MKVTALIVLAVAMLAGLAFLYHLHYRVASSSPVAHVRNEFEFMVHAPCRVTVPLFGADGERVCGRRTLGSALPVSPTRPGHPRRGVQRATRPPSCLLGQHGL